MRQEVAVAESTVTPVGRQLAAWAVGETGTQPSTPLPIQGWLTREVVVALLEARIITRGGR